MSQVIISKSYRLIKRILNMTMITSTLTLLNGNVRLYAMRISVYRLFRTLHRENETLWE
jgi:hypothetical protein